MGIRDRIKNKADSASDAVKGAVHRTVDKVVRCRAVDANGRQCTDDKGHRGRHSNSGGTW